MSIFSQMKRAHKHKEQSLKPVEQSHEKPSSYKHIPTHAASDAITGSPASWDAKERSKIREENRKRSAMAAAHAHAYHMNMPSAPQGGSGSSSVAYTSGEVAPMVPPPGAISWHVPNYSNPYSDEDTYTRPSSHKGKEVDRRGACYFDSPHGSPSSNKGGTTPQESSRRSLSSQDVLDTCLKPVRSVPVTERPATTVGLPHPHRLHPSSRRTSDASIDRSINPYKTSTTKVDRDSRPPPSMRGFHALPPLPQILPIHLNTSLGSNSPTTPSLRGQSSNQSTPLLGSSRRNSLTSLPNLTPTSTRFTISTPPTPTRTVVVKKAEFTMLTPSPRSPSMNFDFQLGHDSLEQIKMAYDIGTPKSNRYEDDPFIDTSVHQLDFGLDGVSRPPTRSYPPRSYVVNVFPEPSSPPNGPPKSRRKFSLSKTGSKLLKKKRWSISKPIISDPIPIN